MKSLRIVERVAVAAVLLWLGDQRAVLADVFPCTESGILQAVAQGGGPHTFDCKGPTTVVTGAEISIGQDVILDGEGNLILDGDASHRVFNIHADASATISGVTIQNGARGDDFEGGGIFNAGVATLTNSTVRDNDGGGIGNQGTMTVTNSTVRDNSGGSFFGGGGITNYGTLTLTNSTVSGNSAEWAGGGVHNMGTLLLTYSTVSGNSAGFAGGGILNGNPPVISPWSRGVGFGDAGEEVTATNSVIANNGYNCFGPIISGGHNLDDDGSCGLTAEGDLSNVDARLAPLGDYGGPTETQALLADSPAIDAGDNDACPSTDQRGVVRPQGAGCDIGAFELSIKDCGNGVIDFGEQCDDGNLIAGDGCSSVCGIECGNGAPDPNEECDDGNLIGGDGCSSTCKIEACAVSAEWECRTASDALLILKQKGDGTRDKLLWKLSGAQATSQEDFADPTENTRYVLCLESDGSRVAGWVVPGSNAKWKALSTRGYRYKDSTASVDGVQRIILKSGAIESWNTARLLVKGKGAHLPAFALPLETPVTVRLVNTNTECCYFPSIPAASRDRKV